MERLLVSHKKYRLHVFFLLLFFVSFSILSQSAWADTTLNLQATWTPPTTNTDGTPLKDLDHYNLYETNSTDSPPARTLLGSVSKNTAPPYPFSVTVQDGSKGTLYFVITAIDTSGNESADSGIGSYNYDLTPLTYTVATSPSGPQVTVDNTPCSTPYTPTTWTVGSQHKLVATSPQNGTSGVRYIFAKWDNGSTSPTRTITVPSTTTTYTAYFTTQYGLTTSVNPSTGGTVTPAGTTWYNSGKSVSVSAKPNFGCTFTNWSGTVPGSGSSMSLTMNGPMTEVANFTEIPEELSPPTTPKNVTNGFTGTSYSFSSKSTSNLHHAVEYQYDWGDTTKSDWGPAAQSHFWISERTYQVTVQARCAADQSVASSLSSPATVTIQQKPFIHVTSPNGGETWVMGEQHNITWASNYLDLNGTVYLYYWFAGAWHAITNSIDTPTISPSYSGSFSYPWTILTPPPDPPSTAIPKSHMSWTSVYIGNWVGGVNGIWQCWDTNDKAFKILENGWVFTISGPDKGGAALWFNTDGTFDGYGVSFIKGIFFEIQGTYTLGANGLINGYYTLTDFSGNVLVSGSITGTPNSNATTMTMTLKDSSNPPVPVFTMSGVWNSDLKLSADSYWSVQISGSAKGNISSDSPLTIGVDPDPNYPNIFNVSGSGTLTDGSSISITQGHFSFFLTPLKTVYGIYDQLIVGTNNEAGTFTGTLNPTTGKFTFNLVSSNKNKYTWAGVQVAAPPPK